jgi:hypothetical protein
MPAFTIAGTRIELEPAQIERALGEVLPEPILEHYVIVRGRRYPPKQVISHATGLDRADFTTHQARRVLKRLGFVASRVAAADASPPPTDATGPLGGRQAAALAPYLGQWVALAGPTEVLVAADTPQEVLAWLARHERRAPYGMFRVPASTSEAEGAAPA